jgi:hypothetical protein
MTERLGAIKLGDPNGRAVPGPRLRATSATTPRTSPAIVDEETKSSSATTPTRRPSTSSRRTATSSTPSFRPCLGQGDPRTRPRVAGVFEPLRRRTARARPGPDRFARTATPRRSTRSRSHRRSATGCPPNGRRPPRVASSSTPPAPAARSNGAPGWAGVRAPVQPRAGRLRATDDRLDPAGPAPTGVTSRPFDQRGPMPPVAELRIAIGRTRTGGGCSRRRRGSPGRTPS